LLTCFHADGTYPNLKITLQGGQVVWSVQELLEVWASGHDDPKPSEAAIVPRGVAAAAGVYAGMLTLAQSRLWLVQLMSWRSSDSTLLHVAWHVR